MVFFAVIGNMAVISVILTKRVLRTKINIYLLNLSIADLLMATLNAMFNFVSMVSVCAFSCFLTIRRSLKRRLQIPQTR